MEFKSSVRLAPAEASRSKPPRLLVVHPRDAGILQAQALRINQSLVKRGLDITIAASLILFLLPALLVISAAIKLSSPGPVLFRQQRYGVGGKKFLILKFRTMTVLESGGTFHQARRNDARITEIGAWLRRSSMDELPQLFNVLAGTMSLVGPRPHATAMDDHYGASIVGYRTRHLVRPGLTGLAQVSGFRGPTDDFEAIAGRIGRDVAYIRGWSPVKDLIILSRTPAALFGGNAF